MIGAPSGPHLLSVGEDIVVNGVAIIIARSGTGAADLPAEKTDGADLERNSSPKLRKGSLMEVPRGGGTQHAKRTEETVLGIGPAAGDDRGGHKGGEAR
ncbi:hypothetical protein DPMN_152069 [Dreissena polymorpha]|uniref:Uncharacterized protein n=1 Tax=Dreissena polymorpha TaxID=45954 RepID=A0A9D4J4U4_DREPO|nr:hypothetical protein DPMN_152069 [Dreissena polymorpha]